MKDIDKLQKRNRTRDFTERLGSSGLALSGLIGLLFLGVRWSGKSQYSRHSLVAKKEKFLLASESIPKTDYILKNGILPM